MVDYLSHMIFAEGITMDVDKEEAVNAWPTPHTIWVVHGFLGLMDYYWKFIRSYGNIVALLTQLLKQESFCWSLDVMAAFNVLKSTLVSTPIP
jgi:hypothetical protein